MKENLKNWLIGGLIIILLVLPIVIKSINSKKIEVKKLSDFNSNISKSGFALYYFGDTNKDDYTSYKKNLSNIKNKYKVSVYTINNKELTKSEKEQLTKLNNEFTNENVYAFIVDSELRKVTSEKLELKDLEKLVRLYTTNEIAEEDIAYKTLSTYKEYMALVNSKHVTMAVFGRNSCGWCNKFKPIYNEVAADYDIDIYYFDSDSFDQTEYNKILNSGLTIPASCSSTRKEIKLSEGFGTPLTLYTKNGETIDCISGYTNKTNLVAKLKEVNLIK